MALLSQPNKNIKQAHNIFYNLKINIHKYQI